MARKLHIAIKDKVATYSQRDGFIVCGNSDYIIEFAFDGEWDGHTTKTARFISNGSYEDVVFTGNTVAVPVMRNTTSVSVGVFSGDLTTSTPAVIGCEKSILCEGGIPSDPTPDVYNQIIALLNNSGAGGGSGSDGYSPTIEVTKLTNGHLLTITDKNGTQYVTVTNGTNGVSPTVEVTAISGGHRVAITDVNGTQTFDVMDGSGSGSGSGSSVVVGSVEPTTACLWLNTSGYEAETVTHEVTYTLSNCLSREGGVTHRVDAEGQFQDEIYANDGYTLFCVTVLMGGVEIYKSQPYNAPADGGIYIGSVTGDVEIIAEALVAYDLTLNLTNCTSVSSSIIFDGDYRTIGVSAMPGYEITDENVTITMGGADITDDAWYGDSIYIQKATGDIVATIVGTPTETDGGDEEEVITYTVTYDLTNCVSREGYEDCDVCEVVEGEEYQDEISAADGYTLDNVSVTMGGQAVSGVDGFFYIASVTGDIVISATATAEDTGGDDTETTSHQVTYYLNGVSSREGGDTSVVSGSPFQDEIAADDGYTMVGVVVTKDGNEITSQVYNSDSGVISISSVDGDIAIYAVAKAEGTDTVYYDYSESCTGCMITSSGLVGEGTLLAMRSLYLYCTPTSGNKMQSLTVTIGGKAAKTTVSDSSASFHIYVTGDVHAEAVAVTE